MRIPDLYLERSAPSPMRGPITPHQAGIGACGLLRRRAIEARARSLAAAQGRCEDVLGIPFAVAGWFCIGYAIGLVLIVGVVA